MLSRKTVMVALCTVVFGAFCLVSGSAQEQQQRVEQGG